MADRICSIPGCGKPHAARGWCDPHYRRYVRNGSPLAGRTTTPGAAVAFYLANVDRETDSCILWPYAPDRGYGVLQLGGQTCRVHRLSCERHHGPPTPEKPYAAHAPVICHNTLCFNGKHVRWDSPPGNSADMLLDGTARTGERNGQALLTWAQVREIRSRYAAGGILMRELGIEYGVGATTIGLIINGKTWRES